VPLPREAVVWSRPPRVTAKDDEQQHQCVVTRLRFRVDPSAWQDAAHVLTSPTWGDRKGGANRSVVWLRRARGLSTFREPGEELPSTLHTFMFCGDEQSLLQASDGSPVRCVRRATRRRRAVVRVGVGPRSRRRKHGVAGSNPAVGSHLVTGASPPLDMDLPGCLLLSAQRQEPNPHQGVEHGALPRDWEPPKRSFCSGDALSVEPGRRRGLQRTRGAREPAGVSSEHVFAISRPGS
jgi:hypothetical protein